MRQRGHNVEHKAEHGLESISIAGPNRIVLAWFSGTGGTERVGRCLAAQLETRGNLVQTIRLRTGEPVACDPHDRLVVLFAVHAMNAPEPVYAWLDALPSVQGAKAAVLSVSGGGEVSPNTACRLGCIRRLRKKGYSVDYDDMLVMPSNWIVATCEPLARMLLAVLPQRVSSIADDFASGREKYGNPHVIDRFLSFAGQLEQAMAPQFGRNIRVTEGCTGCGRCMAICPRGNIRMENGKPVFLDQCVLCLGCIYGCPHKALQPRTMKWIVVPGGYDLAALDRMGPLTESVDIQKLTRGYIWSGIRKYLLKREE
jgi:ferredoxin